MRAKKSLLADEIGER